MAGRPKRSWWYAVWIAIVLVGAGGFYVAYHWLQPQRFLAARIAAQLNDTPTTELPERMQSLAACGEAGLPYLVAALKHPRPEVAREARGTLSEQLDQWQMLSPRLASRRLAILASELARDIEACSPATRLSASDLATRMLLWPVDASAVNQPKLIADCERVLIATRGTDPRKTTPLLTARRNSTPLAQLSPLDEELILPGGNLPLEMVQVPTLPAQENRQPRELPATDPPQLRPVSRPDDEPYRLFPDQANERPEPPEPHKVAAKIPTSEQTMSQFYRLVSADAEERDDAEDRLRQQGFGEAELNVARRFASPSAEVRRKLAQQLAGQSVVPPRPWLLQLLVDRDRSVRLAAAQVLVTNRDPRLLRTLREHALSENDAEVRALLEQASD